MPDIQVVFLQTPQQGLPSRFVQNGCASSSSPAVQVTIDPNNPGWYRVVTQSGSNYVGPVNGNATQVVASSPQIHVNIQYPACPPPVRKNKTAAGLLALFLGGLGVHRFYLGQVGLGFLYLCFFWTCVPAFVALIDAIILFCMSEQTFHWKYGV